MVVTNQVYLAFFDSAGSFLSRRRLPSVSPLTQGRLSLAANYLFRQAETPPTREALSLWKKCFDAGNDNAGLAGEIVARPLRDHVNEEDNHTDDDRKDQHDDRDDDADAESDTHAKSDTHTDTDTDSDADTDAESDAHTHADTDPHPNTDTNTDPNPNAGADSAANRQYFRKREIAVPENH